MALVLSPPANSQEISPEAETKPAKPKAGLQRVNGIAAKVNGEAITDNELMIKVAPYQSVLMARAPMKGPAYEEALAKYKSSVLDSLIDRTIIFTEFKDRVRALPDQQIEDEVKRIVQNVYNGNEELFRKYLKATNLTRDQFKEQQRKELLVQAIRAQHFGDVATPKEAELRAEYDRWKFTNRDRTKDVGTYRKIFLRSDRGGGPRAQFALANQLVQRLKAGEDFAGLASVHSDGAHAPVGGLWENVSRKDTTPEFSSFLFETEGEEIVGPFGDRFGFNIIQILDRKFGPAPPFEEVRDQMVQRVVSEKKKLNFEKWMKNMRRRAEIENNLFPNKPE